MDHMQGSASKDKRYTFVGQFARPVVRQDRNGNDWIAFELRREQGAALRCVAFTDRAARIIAEFNEGRPMKVFGYFEKRQFHGSDGKLRTVQQLKVLWAGDPHAHAHGHADEGAADVAAAPAQRHHPETQQTARPAMPAGERSLSFFEIEEARAAGIALDAYAAKDTRKAA